MIQDRGKEIAFGILFAIGFSLALFSIVDLDGSSTGSAVNGVSVNDPGGTVLSGIGFTVVENGVTHDYIFSNGWYLQTRSLDWVKQENLGNTLWTGLYYFQSNDAQIYFDGAEIKDIGEFAKEMR